MTQFQKGFLLTCNRQNHRFAWDTFTLLIHHPHVCEAGSCWGGPASWSFSDAESLRGHKEARWEGVSVGIHHRESKVERGSGEWRTNLPGRRGASALSWRTKRYNMRYFYYVDILSGNSNLADLLANTSVKDSGDQHSANYSYVLSKQVKTN